MRELWEIVLEAKKEQIPLKDLRFVHEGKGSAYMELSLPFMNQEELQGEKVIGVNTYCRFYSIFKHMYQPDQKEFPYLRNSLTNLIIHMLAENDARRGMTKEEYYKQFLYQNIRSGAFGRDAADTIELFKREERELILSGLLRQYQTGSSLDIFKDMAEELLPENIIYHSNENYYEILVYVGVKKEEQIVAKVELLKKLFVDLPYHVDVYYEHHFGIIGVEETMRIDEIALC